MKRQKYVGCYYEEFQWELFKSRSTGGKVTVYDA
jgi:hypothetical protein